MFRRRLISLLVVLCAVPLALMGSSAQTQNGTSPAPKEKPNPIDVFYDACSAKTSSTPGMVDCATKAEALWDKQMNKDYQSLLKSSNSKTAAKIRAAQRAWVGFRDKEEAAQSEFYDRQGTMWRVARAATHMQVVKDRANQLAGYLSDNESH